MTNGRNGALAFFLLLSATPMWGQVGTSLVSVPADFGRVANDIVLSYGAQYQATPRHAGPYSAAFALPGSLSYTIRPWWTARADATTLKSVDFSPGPRNTGVGDMDIGTTFVVATESKWPGLTADYQLNIPTGSSAEKLGAGHFGHRFTLGTSKTLTQQWALQGSAGDLLVANKQLTGYDNAVFTAVSVTYSFPAKDLTSAVPTLKNEIDFIPAYASKPTESYTVTTFSLPLKWQIKMNLLGRAGLTPYTPKWVAMVQFQYLFPRHHNCTGCL
jgi:hypothetical protein